MTRTTKRIVIGMMLLGLVAGAGCAPVPSRLTRSADTAAIAAALAQPQHAEETCETFGCER